MALDSSTTRISQSRIRTNLRNRRVISRTSIRDKGRTLMDSTIFKDTISTLATISKAINMLKRDTMVANKANFKINKASPITSRIR